MTGPKQVPDNSEGGSWDDWKDFTRPGEESRFSYNPAAEEITNQDGAFPEVTDYEPPEKD
jgi:hypothetical protein